ncbi:MAG: hypothetical protein WAM28_07705 [Chlamydiales bacterium]
MIKKLAISLLILSIASGEKGKAAENQSPTPQNYQYGYCSVCDCYPCRCPSPSYAQPVLAASCAPCPHPCPPPNPCFPCDPCAPVCGTQCGLTVCAIGAAVALVVITAAIIVSTGEASHVHAANL